jgi:hypothetical protein
MRTTDIIRAVLDLIDGSEQENKVNVQVTAPPEQGEPIASRFKQIFAMLDAPNAGPLANSPNEVVADIDSVTTLAGGGVNGPKHPHDIRVKDPSAYPDQQE